MKKALQIFLSIWHVSLLSIYLSTRCNAKTRKRLLGQKENAKSRFREWSFRPATRVARRNRLKKDTRPVRPHPCCPREWSIDRSRGTRDDLLVLVQLGEICKNVYPKAPNRGPSCVFTVAGGFVVSIRVLRNEGFTKDCVDCHPLNALRDFENFLSHVKTYMIKSIKIKLIY